MSRFVRSFLAFLTELEILSICCCTAVVKRHYRGRFAFVSALACWVLHRCMDTWYHALDAPFLSSLRKCFTAVLCFLDSALLAAQLLRCLTRGRERDIRGMGDEIYTVHRRIARPAFRCLPVFYRVVSGELHMYHGGL